MFWPRAARLFRPLVQEVKVQQQTWQWRGTARQITTTTLRDCRGSSSSILPVTALAALGAQGLLSLSDGRSHTGKRGFVAASGPPNSGVTVEDVATIPAPGVSGPGSIAFAPGGDTLTYLVSPQGGLRRELRAMDISTGKVRELCKPPENEGNEENFTLEEKLRRERAREMFTGITKYAWSDEGETVLVPIGNELYVQQGLQGTLARIFDPAVLSRNGASSSSSVLDPRMSPDGSMVCFVYDSELYVAPTTGNSPPRQLTTGARGTAKTNGLADFIAQEEMDRYDGYWISPDSKKVAFTQVDESSIPVYRIVHQGSDAVGEGAQEDHHYPFAGAINPKVNLGVVSTGGGPTTWFDLDGRFDDGDNGYLARVNWLPDGKILAQMENRLQTRLDVLCLDPSTGKVYELFREETPVWINLHHMCKPLKKSNRLLWASERSGFRHLYLYDLGRMEAKPLQLTSGNWVVMEIAAVDEDKGVVYFVANEGDWNECHLYSVSLQGGAPTRITQEPGSHGVVVNTKKGYFVDSFSCTKQPLKIHIRSLTDGRKVGTLFESTDERIERMKLQPPEFEQLTSTDGKVTLQACLYKPDPAKFGMGPYPTLVSTYGGPHVQYVANKWARMTADLRAQFYCARGYLVIKVDNRGSNHRGLDFEGAVKHDMGNLEIADQVAGVRHFVKKGLCDPTRVGIYGWSYGGYMSAMALVKEPNVFKAAVSGAPVTHWDGYDTHYTERYMGTPQINPDGYERSAVMKHVDGLQGHLMLVHGLIDENVHFRHTARLINSLIRARKPYELLLFPDERHSPRSLKDRVYMEERMAEFFDRTLNVSWMGKSAVRSQL